MLVVFDDFGLVGWLDSSSRPPAVIVYYFGPRFFPNFCFSIHKCELVLPVSTYGNSYEVSWLAAERGRSRLRGAGWIKLGKPCGDSLSDGGEGMTVTWDGDNGAKPSIFVQN